MSKPISTEALATIAEQLKQLPLEDAKPIDAFIVGPNRLDAQRLANNDSGDFRLKLDREGLLIPLSEPTFVTTAQILVNSGARDKIQLQYATWDGKRITAPHSFPDESPDLVNFQVGGIIREIVLQSQQGFWDFTKVELKALRLVGIPLSEIDKSIDQLAQINGKHSALQEQAQEVLNQIDLEKTALSAKQETLLKQESALKTAILEKTSTRETLDSQIQELDTRLATLDTQRKESDKAAAEAEGKRVGLVTRLDELTQMIAQRENGISELDNHLKNKQSKLRELTSLLSLYSNEYSSFFRQGNWYIILYSILAALPLCLMAFVTYELFKGAVDLTVKYTVEPQMNLWAIFVTRAPFVAVAGFIMQGAYLAFKLLILKIMDIQTEKMALSRISIVAQDVVQLSAQDLKLTDEQIHDANIYLRMDMIKAHMKEQLGKEYQYRTRDISILNKIFKKTPGSPIKTIQE